MSTTAITIIIIIVSFIRAYFIVMARCSPSGPAPLARLRSNIKNQSIEEGDQLTEQKSRG